MVVDGGEGARASMNKARMTCMDVAPDMAMYILSRASSKIVGVIRDGT